MSEVIQIDNKQIILTDSVIGKGAFGEVIVARWRNCDVAYKRSHGMDNDDSSKADMTQEIDMLSKLRHPNLVLFLGIVQDHVSSQVAIVTELMPCSLYDILEVKKVLVELPFLLDIALDVVNGLDYLHRSDPPIVHRDISSKNILIHGNRAKIADLGQAKLFQQSVMSRQTGMPGAMAYSAPEVLTGRYSTKIDIFSFGILFCQLCTGDYPRIDRRDDQIQTAQRKFPMFADLITSMVHYQPPERLEAKLIGEYLLSIKANDRYYPPNRRYSPESEIGVVAANWMKEEMQKQHHELLLQVEQKEKLVIAEQTRWKQEATKYDNLTSSHQILQTQYQEQEQKEKTLKTQYDTLQGKYNTLQAEKQQCRQEKDQCQQELFSCKQSKAQLENQLMVQHVTVTEKQTLIQQQTQQLQQQETRLQEAQSKQQTLTKQNEYLQKQHTIQQEYGQELEQRLELILLRWKEEKFNTQQEQQRYAKLNQQYSQLIDEKGKLIKELTRCEDRLVLYEGLPMPEEIKLRLTNMQEDYQRLKIDYLKLEEDKNELYHQSLNLEDQVFAKQHNIELLQESYDKTKVSLDQKDEQYSELKSILEDFKQKYEELKEQNEQIIKENSQLQSASKQMLDELNSLTKQLLSTKQQLQQAQAQSQSSESSVLREMTQTNDVDQQQVVIASSNDNSNNTNTSSNNRTIAPDTANEMTDIAVKHLIDRSGSQSGMPGLVVLLQSYRDERIVWRALRSLRERILKNDTEKVQLLAMLDKPLFSSSSSSTSVALDTLFVRILQDHPKSVMVQGQTARLAGTLAFGNDLVRRKLGEKQILQYFVEAMKQFVQVDNEEDIPVLLHLCTAVTNLTHSSPENRSRFLEAGGVPVLIQIMRRQLVQAKVQCQCCWVVLTLAGSNDVAEVISNQGGDLTIIQAMIHHALDVGVQQYGCWAIHNLALASMEIAANLKRRGAMEVCKMAMENHFDHEEIMKQGKAAMQAITGSGSSNNNTLQQSVTLPLLSTTNNNSHNNNNHSTSQKTKKKVSSNKYS